MKIINNEPHYSITETAKLLNLSRGRVHQRLRQDKNQNKHKTVFPNIVTEKVEHELVWIPESDIKNFKKSG